MEKFLGKWQFLSSENFDEYLGALGVNWLLRKAANTAKPDLYFTKEGDDSYKMRSVSTVRTTENIFKLGVEFDDKTPDGRDVKCTYSSENENKLVQEQVGATADKSSKIIREIDESGTMVITLHATTKEGKEVTCVRKYTRVGDA